MSQVTVNDIDVSYTVEGSGDPVIFIHGLAEDHHTWQVQQHALNQIQSIA
jgi:pimeloyl-ACP methyl ester carboxylesterase